MISVRWARVLILGVLALVVVPAACTEGGIVGGKCRDGLTACDGKCVSLLLDPSHCGACGNACPSGVACVAGTCNDFN